MTNAGFTEIHQYRDVETLNFYDERIEAGDDPVAFLLGAAANGRDNARTPMQWSAEAEAGFTSGTPWIGVNANYMQINAEAQASDERSVLAHYRRLIALRKEYPVLVDGDYEPWLEDDPQLFVYVRRHSGQRLVVVANFSAEAATLKVPAGLAASGRCLIENCGVRDSVSGRLDLKPYEAFAVLAD